MKTQVISKVVLVGIFLICLTSGFLNAQLEKVEIKNGFIEGQLFVKDSVLYSDRITVKFRDCVFDLKNGKKYANLDRISDIHSNLKSVFNFLGSTYRVNKVFKQFPDAIWEDTKRINKRTGKEVDIIDNSQVFIIKFDSPVPVQETLSLFRSLNIIEYAKEPAIICFYDEPNDDYYRDDQNNVQWYFDAFQADDAWDISHGSNDIVIGIIDLGFYTNHPDIVNKVISSDGSPENHGTEVASVAAASSNNSIGVASLGWNTKLRLYDGMDQPVGDESTTASKITVAAHYCDIINMSFGIFRYVTLSDLYELAYYCPRKDKWVGSLITTNNSAISSAISNAISQGVICIASAGNGTKNTSLPNPELCDLNAVPYIVYPAAYPDVIAVSGTTLDGLTEIFNTDWNYGSFVDISAPGTDIVVATSSSSYDTKNGTSYSAPMVAALASLIIALDPYENTENIIKSNADKIDSYTYVNGWNNRLGYGRINAYNALNACFPQKPTGLSLTGSIGQYPTLSWNSNSENDLDGYLLYQKIGSGNEYVIANLNENITSYIDHGVIIGNGKFDPLVKYRLSAYDLANNESEKTNYVYTKAGGINKPIVNPSDEIIPTEFTLHPAYPNPFNSSTVLKYDIPKRSIVNIQIYDDLGKMVWKSNKELKNPGTYQVIWEGKSSSGKSVPSGVYHVKLFASSNVFYQRITLMK